MNTFNEKEFLEICKRFDVIPFTKDITIQCKTAGFFNKVKCSVEKDRRGEVVFCLIRPNRKIVAITCKEYPEGIFRIPTGGIGHNEDIVRAVYRETREELGVDAEIIKFVGVLKLRFELDSQSEMFYSYIFILKETGGRLLLDASDDEISEVREVDVSGLEAVVDSLGKIEGKWRDWGLFRYESSKAVLDYLKKYY